MRPSRDLFADTFDLLTPGYDGELEPMVVGFVPRVPVARQCGETCRFNSGAEPHRCVYGSADCPFRKKPAER